MFTLACCSDTHGTVPPLLSGNISAWLHGGDVYEGAEPTRGTAELRAWLSRQTVPVLAVRGNHDVVDTADVFANGRDITAAIQRISEGLFVAGIGWHGERYYEVPTQNNMDELCGRLQLQIMNEVGIGDRLILLTHYPADVPDAADWPGSSGGYAAIGDLIAAVHPAVVIQGHDHEWFGVVREIAVDDFSCLAVHPGSKGMLLHVEIATGRVWVEGGEE